MGPLSIPTRSAVTRSVPTKAKVATVTAKPLRREEKPGARPARKALNAWATKRASAWSEEVNTASPEGPERAERPGTSTT